MGKKLDDEVDRILNKPSASRLQDKFVYNTSDEVLIVTDEELAKMKVKDLSTDD